MELLYNELETFQKIFNYFLRFCQIINVHFTFLFSILFAFYLKKKQTNINLENYYCIYYTGRAQFNIIKMS